MVRRTAVTGTEDELVLRPALVVIVKDIIKMIGIKSGIHVKYDGKELLKNKSTGGVIGVNDTPMEYLEILAEFESENNGGIFQTPLSPESEPFFHHKDSGCKLNTVYSDTDMVLKVMHKTKSAASANILNSNMRLLIASGGFMNIHSIDIGYVLPKVIKKIVNMTYEFTKDVDKLDLDAYISKCFDSEVSRVDLLNHLSGNAEKAELTIREEQANLKGRVVGKVKEEKPKKDDGYYVTEFEYRVPFMRPLAIQSEYPMMIYNNYLDDLFYNSNTKERSDVKYLRGYESINKLLKRHNSFGLNPDGYYLTYPAYDEFTLDNTMKSYYPVITLINQVDGSDIMFNIEDLGGLSFKKSVIEFLKSEHEYLGLSYMSLFYFALYKDDVIDTSNRLVVDETLNIRPMNPLDIKSCYRVVIMITKDISSLKSDRKRAIIDYCDAEILRNQELIRGSKPNNESSGVRDNGGVGLEQVKSEDMVLDVYFNFFDVKDEDISNAVHKVSTRSTAEAMFKVQLPDFGSRLITGRHTTVVSRMFEED